MRTQTTPVVDPNGNIAAFCGSTGGWLPLLCTMNCTLATELMRAQLGVGLAEFEASIAAVERGLGRTARAAVLQRRAHAEPAECAAAPCSA